MHPGVVIWDGILQAVDHSFHEPYTILIGSEVKFMFSNISQLTDR